MRCQVRVLGECVSRDRALSRLELSASKPPRVGVKSVRNAIQRGRSGRL